MIADKKKDFFDLKNSYVIKTGSARANIAERNKILKRKAGAFKYIDTTFIALKIKLKFNKIVPENGFFMGALCCIRAALFTDLYNLGVKYGKSCFEYSLDSGFSYFVYEKWENAPVNLRKVFSNLVCGEMAFLLEAERQLPVGVRTDKAWLMFKYVEIANQRKLTNFDYLHSGLQYEHCGRINLTPLNYEKSIDVFSALLIEAFRINNFKKFGIPPKDFVCVTGAEKGVSSLVTDLKEKSNEYGFGFSELILRALLALAESNKNEAEKNR